MTLLDAIREHLASLERKPAFRIAVAAVFSVLLIVTVSFYHATASDLQRLTTRVPEILSGLDLARKDPAAVQLVEKGTLLVDGREIGDESLATAMQRTFGENGRVERIAEASNRLISVERPGWMPIAFANDPSLLLILGAAALAVVNFAAFTGLAVPLVGVTVFASAVAAVCLWRGQPDLAASLAAVPSFLFLFALLIRLILLGLDRASPMFAVAGGVVREAMRLRIAVVFAAVAIAAIPLLPAWIDPTTPLRYQIQTFLSRSLDIMYVVCAFLTVFFGCATVAFEIRDRQAWLTLTKPVSRLSWLAGKWLGVVCLNAAILLVCTFAMVAFLAQMRTRPALDALDASAVRNEILVARVGGFPRYEPLGPGEIRNAVEEAIRADPNAQADMREGRRTELDIQKTLARAINDEYLKQQRAIGPGQERQYRFDGLAKAREAGAPMSLRYKFYAGESDPHTVYPVIFIFGEDSGATWVDRQFIAAQSNVVSVPANAIRPDGTLVLRIANVRFDPEAPAEAQFSPSDASIAFDPDGIELLYRTGDFEGNLLRAQLVNLLKLSFVSMLAVTLSSFLSFPVACLVVFTIFTAGSVAPYLATSIEEYRIRTDSSVVKGFEAVVRGIASGTEFAVRSFGEARASGPLVEGRLVPWAAVFQTFALIGVAWSGVLLLVSFFVFRRKELAIYSGQGG